MVSFIHSGSEITTWMGQNQKHKIQINIFKLTTSFLNFKLQIIRLAQRSWSCTPTTKTGIFIVTPIWVFYQRVFFVNLLTEKIMLLVPNYYMLAGDTN